MIKSFESSRRPGVVVCTVGAALDFRTAAYFHCQCDDLLDAGYRHFVLDLSQTTVLDSSGLGAVFASR